MIKLNRFNIVTTITRLRAGLYVFVCLLTLLSTPASALSTVDQRALNYNTVFYNETDDSLVNNYGACSTGNIPSTTNLDASLIAAINKLKPSYVAAAQKTGVAWQLLAAIHYRENNNNPDGDLQAGNKFGGPYPQFSSDYTSYGYPKNLQESAIIAAKHLIASSSSGVVKSPINIPSPDPNAIKDALFSYNGRASAYAAQAAKYGFNSATQPYEGSPYVMNKYDAPRQAMGIITRDFGGVDGTDARFGAFTIYSRLGGAAGGGDTCSGSTGAVLAIALKELELKISETSTPVNYHKYTDGISEPWCADFLSWVFKESGKPFTGGASGGWRIAAAAGVMDWFKANGTWIDNTAANRQSGPPKPGDVIYYNHGHANMVVSLTGTSVKTVGGNQSNMVSSYDKDLADPDIAGWGRMK